MFTLFSSNIYFVRTFVSLPGVYEIGDSKWKEISWGFQKIFDQISAKFAAILSFYNKISKIRPFYIIVYTLFTLLSHFFTLPKSVNEKCELLFTKI